MDEDFIKYKKYKKKYQELKKLMGGLTEKGPLIPIRAPIVSSPKSSINDGLTSEISTITKTSEELIKQEVKKPNGGLIGGLFLGGAAILAMILGLKR